MKKLTIFLLLPIFALVSLCGCTLYTKVAGSNAELSVEDELEPVAYTSDIEEYTLSGYYEVGGIKTQDFVTCTMDACGNVVAVNLPHQGEFSDFDLGEIDADKDILDRYSYNFTVGVYDTDADILYYCKFDT